MDGLVKKRIQDWTKRLLYKNREAQTVTDKDRERHTGRERERESKDKQDNNNSERGQRVAHDQ